MSGSTRRHRKARATLLATATHCWICGQPARPGDPLVADHLIPRAHGGPDALHNYAAAHKSCNGRRGARWPAPQMPAPPHVTNPTLRVRNPPLQPGEPEPTSATHPHLTIDIDPDSGEKSWWPRWSRDW